MKLVLKSGGIDPDDQTVHYILSIENFSFKGGADFYEYEHLLNEFGSKLLKFPFESKSPVNFDVDNCRISISLHDPAGKISFDVSVGDFDGNLCRFKDYSVDVAALQRLGTLLTSTDFKLKQSLIWNSDLT